jgi:diguanylate cyclase (GGDEF)-like protein
VATLLLIDDSAVQRAHVRRAVDAAGLFQRVVEAENGVDGLKLLLSEPVDVVLCDVEMPGLDGEKLLQFKEARADVRDVPILFLTGSVELDRRVRLIEEGASDTLPKPFHPADLVARLRLHLKLKRLQDELKLKNEALSRLSITDSLTGLRNRRYADEVLAIEVLRARRYRSPLSVLMADVDHFKRVNDEHGHAAGDEVLRGVADRLRETLRATDVGARYGGEEFLVILAQNDSEGAALFGERWREAVAAVGFALPGGRGVSVTISVGVASFAPGIGTGPELVAEADAALYAAKQTGRNRVELRRPR